MAIAILDIDGTLVDTNYQHALAWFRALQRCDVTVPIWLIHRHLGMTTSDDVEQAKPAPDLVHAALQRSGAPGELPVIMVGDTPWDIKSAQAAGVSTLAVVTGGFSAQELREAGAWAVYESVTELQERLYETPLGGSAAG